MVLQVHQVHQDLVVHQDLQVLQDQVVHQVLQVHQDLQGSSGSSGATGAAGGTVARFNGYDNGTLNGSTNFSTTNTTAFLKVDTTQYGLDPAINTNYYTFTNQSDTITVDENGYYIINANIVFLLASRGSNRSMVAANIYINSTKQEDTYSDSYGRGSSYNEDVNVSIKAYYFLSANDTIKIELQAAHMDSSGTGTVSVQDAVWNVDICIWCSSYSR